MRRGRKDYHEPWGWKAVCDICGIVYRGHELRKRWDNMMCCPADMEQRHPQDFIKGLADRQVPPFVRDQPDDLTFVVVSTTDGSNL